MPFALVVWYYYHCILFTYKNISRNFRVYLSKIPYQILKKWIDIYKRKLDTIYTVSHIRDNTKPSSVIMHNCSRELNMLAFNIWIGPLDWFVGHTAFSQQCEQNIKMVDFGPNKFRESNFRSYVQKWSSKNFNPKERLCLGPFTSPKPKLRSYHL